MARRGSVRGDSGDLERCYFVFNSASGFAFRQAQAVKRLQDSTRIPHSSKVANRVVRERHAAPVGGDRPGIPVPRDSYCSCRARPLRIDLGAMFVMNHKPHDIRQLSASNPASEA
jgi:hypothetical protein